MNAFAIGKTTNDLVDALIDDATAIMEGASPGEDAQQKHLGVGRTFLKDGENAFDALSGLCRSLHFVTRVVGPYHHDSNLGLNAIPSALVQAPNHVLGAIPTKSKVDGFAVAVILLPNGLSIAFPSLSDGITNESKVDVPS